MISDNGVAIPDDMATVLDDDGAALTAFQALRPDDQLKWVRWVTADGRAADRTERLGQLASHVQQFHRPAQEHLSV